MIQIDVIVARATELEGRAAGAGSDAAANSEAFHGALNLLQVVHGPNSVQERQLIGAMTAAERAKDGNRAYNLYAFVSPAVQGAMKALVGDVKAGLAGSVSLQSAGGVFADMLALAKDALAAGNDEGHKNVAAVLVAASFEDTLRRLSEAKIGLTDRIKLEDVIGKLKSAGVLVGAAVSTATGYLKFRNDSLHADWQKVDRATIGSCLAFVEGLLQQHFS